MIQQKDIVRHRRSDTPAYSFWVFEKPHTKGKGKKAYMTAVKQAAQPEIPAPIIEHDVEVEIIYSTVVPSTMRVDIDNIIKPTLDALSGVAYLDDAQVRSVTATLFDRTKDAVVSGRVENMGRLFRTPSKDVLLISIYSDSRLQKLGGEQAVQSRRLEEWSKEHRQMEEELLARMKRRSQ